VARVTLLTVNCEACGDENDDQPLKATTCPASFALEVPLPSIAATKPSAIVESEPLSVQAALKAQPVLSSLDSPWGMVFLPNGQILVTMKNGALLILYATKALRPQPLIFSIPAFFG